MSGIRDVVRIIFFLFFFLGCGEEAGDFPDRTRGFRVANADHLFFKNTQARNYATSEDHALRRTVYTHDLMLEGESEYYLHLVDNWIGDRAFLVFSPKKTITDYTTSALRFTLQYPDGEVIFSSASLEDVEALREFYRSLGREEDICYSLGEVTACWPENQAARRGMRATLADFLRMTRLDRKT